LRVDRPRAYLGICRGGQLLNVLNGGTLWQHVHDHGRDHHVIDIQSGKVFKCSSTHHQMFRVPITSHAVPYKVLGVACDKDGKIFQDTQKFFDSTAYEKLEHDRRDIEAMYYPNTNSLCFQPHPEYWGYPQCAELFLSYVENYVIPNLKKKA
jgi:carbamoylphosphate synthase small subunit